MEIIKPRIRVKVNGLEVAPEISTTFQFLDEDIDVAIMDPVKTGESPFCVYPFWNKPPKKPFKRYERELPINVLPILIDINNNKIEVFKK